MVFDKCFLHIGTEKTGTTTLQTFLGTNREELLSRGFFVPRTLSPHLELANHERLTTMSLGLSKLSDDLRVAAGLTQAGQVISHRAAVAEAFMDEVRSLGRSARTLVLSNEHCHSRLTADDEVRTLSEFLFRFSRDVEVIVYLRPQHELAVSLYNQALKAGYSDIDVLPDFAKAEARWVEREFFDYAELVLRWGRVFGGGNITARRFDRETLVGGSVVDDFFRCIGCDTAGLARSHDVNVTISAELQSVLNAINRYAQGPQRALSGDLRFKVNTLLERLSRGPGRKPARADVERFFGMFRQGNELVRRLHFPERASLFDITFDDYPVEDVLPGSEADNTLKLTLELIGFLSDGIDSLG